MAELKRSNSFQELEQFIQQLPGDTLIVATSTASYYYVYSGLLDGISDTHQLYHGAAKEFHLWQN